MPLTYTKTWADGDTLSHTDLNANFQDVAEYIDTTKLALASLQKPYSPYTITSLYTGTIVSGASRTLIATTIPVGIEPVSVTVWFRAISSGTPTVSLTVTDDGGNVLNAALTQGTADTVASTTSFAISSIAAASILKAVVALSGGDATDIIVTIHCKQYHSA